MDIYSVIAILTFLILMLLLATPFAISAFSSNKPSNGSRAGNLKKMAEELGLSYKAEDNRTFWQKVSSARKRENIIEGKYEGKEVLIYDYFSTTNYVAEGNDPIAVTMFNGKSLQPGISTEELKKMIVGENTLNKNIITEKHELITASFNVQIFIVIVCFIVAIDFFTYLFLSETLKLTSIAILIIFMSLPLLFIGIWIAKKSAHKVPIS